MSKSELLDHIRDVELLEIKLEKESTPLPDAKLQEAGRRRFKMDDLLPHPKPGELDSFGFGRVPGSGAVIFVFLRRFGCGVCRYVATIRITFLMRAAVWPHWKYQV